MGQDRILACNEVQRCAYYRTYDSPTPHLGTFTVELLAHTGSGTAPYFTKNKQGTWFLRIMLGASLTPL